MTVVSNSGRKYIYIIYKLITEQKGPSQARREQSVEKEVCKDKIFEIK